MATKPVVISFDLEAADAFEKASELGLEIKQQNEVYAGWSSLNAWRDIFEKDFGLLQRVISRSNPDDPPDLNFEFAMRTLSVEITDILPHPYGQVHSIHQREMPNECITLPPISVKYKSKEEIRQAMVSRLWISEPVGDRRRELLRVVAAQVNRKAKRLVTANVKLDVLVLNDQSSFTDLDRLPLARGLATMRKNRVLQIPERTALLVHSESNFLRFRSFLIDGRSRVETRSKGYE